MSEASPRASEQIPSLATYLGFALLSSCVIALELLLTRVMSLRFFYHYAFAVVSLGMFGLTAGAVVVHWLRARLDERPDLVRSLLVGATLGFAISTPLAYATILEMPVASEGMADAGFVAIYFATAVPFTWAGVGICLLLTRYRHVGRLYSADLMGAGMGGIALIGLLSVTSPSQGVVVLAVCIACTAAAFAANRNARLGSFAAAALLALLGPGENTDSDLLFQRWNAYSRVTVRPTGANPFGWGYSSQCREKGPREQMYLEIDRAVGTPLTGFDGEISGLAFLQCDVTNAVYQIRRGGSVLVIGMGGGRDILSALQVGQRSVTAVEINDLIIEAVAEEFSEFTRHLTRDPRVRVVHAEGRSFAARTDERFDVIQASLVDTFAASTSGAFSLTENGLYTVEGWTTFLDRLTDDGILTMSRWFYYEEPAFETMRLVALARASLDRVGIGNHADKVVVVAGGVPRDFKGLRGTGTILLKKTPFSEAEIERLEVWAQKLAFRLVYAPGRPGLPEFKRLMTTDDLETALAELPVDISAPTDDSPFFFLMRAPDERAEDFESFEPYRSARDTVIVVLQAAVLLTGLVILLPMAIAERGGIARLRSHASGAIFFLGIGTAFMLIEMAQIQRLSVMLGHPIYSLTVVLSTLLVSSGLGSLWIERRLQRSGDPQKWVVRVVVLLLAALVVVAEATVPIVTAFANAADWARFASAAALLSPAGFLMGAMFPMGISIARAASNAPTAWFWALNGAASTLASILAVVISIDYGIRYSFGAGIAAYAVAALALLVYSRGVAAGRFAS